jgi:RNA polymerase sigma-70 factor (ECF subfamily)
MQVTAFRRAAWQEYLMAVQESPVQQNHAREDTVDAGALFEEHHNRIYRYLLPLVRNPMEAEDLTQETFLRAHRHRQALRDPEAVRGWLYRIATHAALDRLRQRKPHVSIDDENLAEAMEPLASSDPSAQEVTEREETSRCVQRCLDFLPHHYRAILLLHEAHGLTAVEIADLLRTNATTVKMRLHRARHLLHKLMECGCAVSSGKNGLPVCEMKSPPAPRS